MELSNLGLAELRALSAKLKAEIARREDEEIARARKKIQGIARDAGVPLKDLLNRNDIPKSPASQRYRHPERLTFVWSGRGRKPLWVVTWLAEGGTLDDLRVGS